MSFFEKGIMTMMTLCVDSEDKISENRARTLHGPYNPFPMSRSVALK